MKANEANLLDLMGVAKMQFIIPVYQRVYSWGVKECAVLWDDVMRAGRDNATHFVGSMLYIPESESSATSISRVLLIDGQQRMTTFSLMIAALANYLEDNRDKAGFLGDLKISALRKNYLFNDDDYNGLARYKLVLSQDDKGTLFSIVSGSPMPDDKSGRIVENFAFFCEKMHGKSFDPARLWAGLNRVQVIDTKLTAGVDNAQLIFESMNSKGKPLTPIDLIRNFVLMSLPNDEQTKLYEDYWHPIERLFGQGGEEEFNAFIWYWLWLKVPNRLPKENEAYHEFKRYSTDDYDGDTEGLLKELREYARRYSSLFLGKEEDSDLRRVFARIASLDVKQIRPLLMLLYSVYEQDKIDRSAFLRISETIESFLFRRAVCGRLTTGLNNFFAGMYRSLEDQNDIEEYVTAMLLIHNSSMTAYFPTDEHFTEEFRTRDCYNRFSKKRYYLERMENWHHPKEPISADDYQIEHVMPQTIDDEHGWKESLGVNWEDIHDRLCNNLGNLTLTGYNQEYSNRSFSDKLNLPDRGLKCSPLYLNKSIASHGKWGEKEIEQRADELAREACEIWKYPNLPTEIVDKYRPSRGETGEATTWTLQENHPTFAEGGLNRKLFEEVRESVLSAHPTWESYITRYYVGFRSGKRTLHAVLEGRTSKGGWIAVGLAKSMDDLVDPEDMCQDKRSQGGFGPGLPTYVALRNADDIPAVLELIKQC